MSAEKTASIRLFIGVLTAVFAMATFVTAFALSFAADGAKDLGSLVVRTWSNAVHIGWANGVAVALVFAVVWYRRIRPPRS